MSDSSKVEIFTQDRYRLSIKVEPEFEEEKSDLAAGQYVFSYTITIANLSEESVQLISRHWIITHDDGSVDEVRGMGVVGHQPTLEPGQGLRYSSWCVLKTSTGKMKGSYQMVAESGTELEMPIPEFMLVGPRVLH